MQWKWFYLIFFSLLLAYPIPLGIILTNFDIMFFPFIPAYGREMFKLKLHLWLTCECSICRLSVAPVAQVRSACPDSISLALSDGDQHLEYQFINDGRKFDEIDAH